MNWQTAAAIASAGVMVLGMLYTLVTLTFRMGALSGQILSFMATAQRDHAEVMARLGYLEAKLDGHISGGHSK